MEWNPNKPLTLDEIREFRDACIEVTPPDGLDPRAYQLGQNVIKALTDALSHVETLQQEQDEAGKLDDIIAEAVALFVDWEFEDGRTVGMGQLVEAIQSEQSHCASLERVIQGVRLYKMARYVKDDEKARKYMDEMFVAQSEHDDARHERERPKEE